MDVGSDNDNNLGFNVNDNVMNIFMNILNSGIPCNRK